MAGPRRQQRACDYQRTTDADANPAFRAKTTEQVAIEVAEFRQTLAEWAAEPNRRHANCCTSPPSKVGDPFRSPEEWAAAGRGRHLKFSFINRDGAKLRARLYAPPGTAGRYPAVTFTPGLQSYNEVNSWFPQGLAEAGYVVLIIDPQGQGDSESCGHRPDGTETTCPATNQPNDTRSAIDFILSTPTQPYRWAQGVNAAGTPTYNPMWKRTDRQHLGIAGHSLGAIAVTPIAQQDARVDAAISYDNLDLSLPAGSPRRTPTLYFGTDYAFPATGTPKASPPDPRPARRSLRPAGRRRRGLDVDHDPSQQPLRVRLPARPGQPPRQPLRRTGRLLLLAGLVRPVPEGRHHGQQPAHRPSLRRVLGPALDRHRHLRPGSGRSPTPRTRSQETSRTGSPASAPPTCCPSTTRRPIRLQGGALRTRTCGPEAARNPRHLRLPAVELDGAVVAVTGASRGIGAAVAKAVAARGSRVGLIARTADDLGAVLAGIGADGVAVTADVADRAAVVAAIAEVEASLGPVDVLVVNAGIGAYGPLVDTSYEEIERLVQVNVLGTMYAIRAVLPGMVARRRGHVVTIGSIAGRIGSPFEAVYSATKFAGVGLTEAFAVEVKPYGVGVSIVNPGVVATEFGNARGHPYDRDSPKPISAESVADAVVAAIEQGIAESYVPRWFRPAVLTRHLVPPLFRWGTTRSFRSELQADEEQR